MKKNLSKMASGVVTAGVLATLALSGTEAKAGVYIVPPDIDQYKAKTDQTFYDIYQNQDSAIGKSVNPNAKSIVNSVNTGQRMMEGYTVPKVKSSNVQGISVISGTETQLYLAGKAFRVKYTDTGVKVIPQSGGLKVKGTVVSTTKTVTQQCASGGKYGCTELWERDVDYSFDSTSGIATATVVDRKRNRNCGKWGCTPWSSPKDINVVSTKQEAINLANLVTGRTNRDIASGLMSAQKIVSETDIARGYGKYGAN